MTNDELPNNSSLLFFIGCLLMLIGCNAPEPDEITHQPEPVDLVYPYLDATNSRWFYFSSASRPFGMVNLSPDMSIGGAWQSGYVYSMDSIKFLSHVHAWQLSALPVLPVTGDFKGHLGPNQYQSFYTHDKETVYPGYHKLFLEDYQVQVELTSTTRVGLHRYRFPAEDQSYILIDFSTTLGPSATESAYVRKVSDRTIEGYVLMAPTRRRPKATNIYFAIETDVPFSSLQAWQQGSLMGAIETFEGSGGGVYMHFPDDRDHQVQMKVAISYVSESQAWKNMDTELPHWDFDQVVTESRSDWNEKLSRIKVESEDSIKVRRFYTDLWKALQGRRIISDVDGQYCDMTGPEKRTGQIPLDQNGVPEFNHHNSDSFWGAQWTITSLWQLVYPEIAEDFVRSMLQMYEDGGLVPRGPSGGNYTYVMTGASSTPFIVGAYMKGIVNTGAEEAYQGLLKNHLPGGMMSKAGYEHQTTQGGGLDQYIELGYVPYPLSDKNYGFHMDGAGQTMEYAYQDWCLAQFAKSLGMQEDYQQFVSRSGNWKNVMDPEIGWSRPKDAAGTWRTPYDPYQYRNGFVESNGAQHTWYVPHDLQGLAEAMGGTAAAAEKLHASFETARELNFTSGKSHSQETEERNRRIPINYGNQPSIQTAFVFNHIGHPWLTQYWSRRVVDQAFSGLSPEEGYNGDEDQGLMGSLAVLMKIGLFEMKSGNEQEPVLELGSPVFDKITILLDPEYFPGKEITISARHNAPDHPYIKSAWLNGNQQSSQFLKFKDLVEGAVLELEMGPEPNKEWGE
jgi:predicted alpha-1,2-mannosidase